ncbi:hypothetical protein JZ751_015627, partial [Albula glossodonta]
GLGLACCPEPELADSSRRDWFSIRASLIESYSERLLQLTEGVSRDLILPLTGPWMATAFPATDRPMGWTQKQQRVELTSVLGVGGGGGGGGEVW